MSVTAGMSRLREGTGPTKLAGQRLPYSRSADKSVDLVDQRAATRCTTRCSPWRQRQTMGRGDVGAERIGQLGRPCRTAGPWDTHAASGRMPIEKPAISESRPRHNVVP
jgi:hypothetical protein